MSTLAVVATTAEVLARPELGEHLLARWELDRLALVRRPDRRADVLAARLLVRLCAARLTGQPVAEVALAQLCEGCGRSGHGRPYLPGRPGVGISLSHADGVVAAAAGPGPVGVDVEPAGRRPPPPAVLRRVLPAAGAASGAEWLRRWVRAEAEYKAGPGEWRPEEWTDAPRAAVAAVASRGPVSVVELGSLGSLDSPGSLGI
ncbi:4-phosphopantetheinyl transferase [Kitasatospora sp. NPDC002227]|uniref:4'-phosphopantetheinyl transferase family protein n=1 Tax=Kitasatospora sp. NPDC002227 TaxID=3154773 RepID=UPI003330D54F